MSKVYLGDAVYCEFDGFQLKLTTERMEGGTNTIYIEPEVWKALKEFAERFYGKDDGRIITPEEPK